MAADAALAAGVLCAPANVSDIDREWTRLRDQLAHPVRRKVSGAPRRVRLGLAGATLSAGTAAVVAVLVAGAAAAAVLTTVYAPTRVTPVQVSTADLAAIESFAGLDAGQLSGPLPSSGSQQLPFGELTWSGASGLQQVSSIAQARSLTQLAFAAPARLPAGVGPLASVEVQPQVTLTLRISKSAGQAVGGSTLVITAGPAILVQYGGGSGSRDLTTLAVAVMRRPVATSTGATAGELESFVLSQGQLPGGLAQQLRLLDNPATVLPVPVPPGMTAQQLTVRGAAGVLVADPSDAASGVIWEGKDGVVHGAGGLLGKRDILDVAQQVG